MQRIADSTKLLNSLLKNGTVDFAGMKKVNALQNKGKGFLDALVESGAVSEEDAMMVLSSELELPPVDPLKCKIDKEILRLVPEQMARQLSILPISKAGKALVMAMADPCDIFALDSLSMTTGHHIFPVLSTKKLIREAIMKNYESKGMSNLLEQVTDNTEVQISSEEKEEVDVITLADQAGEAPVIRLANHLIIQAMRDDASDIHVEPQEGSVRVRFRIDGVLHEKFSVPKTFLNAIISRLKIMCNLDIAERRAPQDGRFKAKIGDSEVDFRVSIIPGVYGEKAALRVLDGAKLPPGVDELGFDDYSLEKIKESLTCSHGIILVTGPTGSGKTTTLYSILKEVNNPDTQIMTIEDPVEYRLKGINQIPVNEVAGLSFVSGLRTILRQDPNVIMVGEMRDSETADTAIKAAITGHLTLSTLHTNDAPSSVQRLVNMGIQPFLIASALRLVLAQRLCRKVCTKCRRLVEIPAERLKTAGFELAPDIAPAFYEGKGCHACNNTGYKGRTIIAETLCVNEQIKLLIEKGAPSSEIASAAKASGMRTLRQAGFLLVAQGVTTLEEVMRST